MALASRDFDSAPPTGRRARRQRRQLLIAAAVAGVGVLLFAGPQVVKALRGAPVDPNRAIAAQAIRLGAALDAHATRLERPKGVPALPSNAAFFLFVQGLGESVLQNPWDGAPQTALAPAGGTTGLPTAAQHQAGAPLPIVGTALGPGTLPGIGPITARTYGAIVYDHDPNSDSYVLYGIGQRGEQAVVAAAVARKP